MCPRATIASSTWNECQMIDIFYSLLAASICCPRDRRRCGTVIHACLQPARGLCLKAELTFCVRPGHAFAHNTKRRTAAAGKRITLCTYLQPWRGTARGLQSFGARTATRMQFGGRNVPCKQYCASGLQQHLVICTEDVTAARRTLQRLQIFSGDTTASSSSSNPRTSAN